MQLRHGFWAFVIAPLLFAGCGDGATPKSIRIDGSSTVYPITEAVLEKHLAVEPNLRITAGFSGTGGGFKKFIAGETEINDG